MDRKSLSLQTVVGAAVQEIQRVLQAHPMVVLATKSAAFGDKQSTEVIRLMRNINYPVYVVIFWIYEHNQLSSIIKPTHCLLDIRAAGSISLQRGNEHFSIKYHIGSKELQPMISSTYLSLLQYSWTFKNSCYGHF